MKIAGKDMTFEMLLKNVGIEKLLLLAICGVVIIICSFDSGTKENKQQQTIEYSSESEIKYMDEMEVKLKNILEGVEGLSNINVMITYKADETVEGIVISAKNGSNPIVMEKIMKITLALFDVSANKIAIINGK